MAALGLIKYLIRVSEDPAERDRWAKDREGAIRASRLSKKHKELLLRNNRAEIEKAVHRADSGAQVIYSKKDRKKIYVTVSFITVSLPE
jgi:hypothetical protein